MKVNREKLLQALEKVRPGLAKKELLEQTTSFAFVDGQVVTYNDEISVSHPVTEGLTGAVKAELLFDLLKKVKQDEVDLTVDQGMLLVSAGRIKAGIVCEADIKLPLDDLQGEKAWIDLPNGPQFREALKFVLPCCGNNMSRAILTCVHVGKTFVEASDGYQLARVNLAEELPFTESVLIRASAVRHLVDYDVSQVALGDAWIHFRTPDGTVFSARTVQGTYPDTSNLCDVKGHLVEFPDAVRDVVDKAADFVAPDASADYLPVVEVEITGGKLTVYAKNEYGWLEGTARAKTDASGLRFRTSVEFLMNMLGRSSKCYVSEGWIQFIGDNWIYVAVTLA